MTYREAATSVPGAVLWQNAPAEPPSADEPVPGGTRRPSLILPDGCVDLIWNGRELFVAGPDTRARWFQGTPDDRFAALRLSGGLGPALLGVPADQLTDRSPALADLWSAATARRLTERVAADPVSALTAWLADGLKERAVDPLGPRVSAMVAAGLPIATTADRVGLSARQLHRRCLPLFGYGPRHLARVLRMQRAIAAARSGRPLAQVAAGCGYCDQAHLSREVRALTGTTPARLLAPQPR